MAVFNIPNENLFDFAVFNYRLQQQIGMVAFDREDYHNIVKGGTTNYYFSDGDTIEDALGSLMNKAATDLNATNILLGVEIGLAFIDQEGGLAQIERAFVKIADTIVSQDYFWNIYPVEEPVCRMHLLINF